jgi:hypothetical protein
MIFKCFGSNQNFIEKHIQGQIPSNNLRFYVKNITWTMYKFSVRLELDGKVVNESIKNKIVLHFLHISLRLSARR